MNPQLQTREEMAIAILIQGFDSPYCVLVRQIKNSVEDELSDVVIRCLDLAGLRGIDFRYADMLLSEGIREVQTPFPELMYLACEEITYHGYDLTEKLNALIAGIIAYCNQKYIDIDLLITTKMKYNRLRPYMHGDKRY